MTKEENFKANDYIGLSVFYEDREQTVHAKTELGTVLEVLPANAIPVNLEERYTKLTKYPGKSKAIKTDRLVIQITHKLDESICKFIPYESIAVQPIVNRIGVNLCKLTKQLYDTYINIEERLIVQQLLQLKKSLQKIRCF